MLQGWFHPVSGEWRRRKKKKSEHHTVPFPQLWPPDGREHYEPVVMNLPLSEEAWRRAPANTRSDFFEENGLRNEFPNIGKHHLIGFLFFRRGVGLFAAKDRKERKEEQGCGYFSKFVRGFMKRIVSFDVRTSSSVSLLASVIFFGSGHRLRAT